MADLIKCPKCNTWNEDRDYCIECNHLLNYQRKRALEIEEQEIAYKNREKDKVDLIWEDIKNSDSFWKKMVYYALKSAWFMLILFVIGALSIVVFGPG